MIKVFSLDDMCKCVELFVQVFNAPPWNNKWTNNTAWKYLQEFSDSKQFLGYTLWDNDIIIGAVFGHLKSWYGGDEIYIDELYISPDYQRKGYGIALMDTVEKFAKENSFSSITLLTGVGSPAFSFYEKIGYKHLEHLAFMHKRVV